ncbi:hypothetical protein GCM10007860_31160 [Chitiniphilus shinanonensis]|uniref:Histidine kinase domain-containing protein n=2 Tax=Chitiniphilus shinanonensis TaxID=553088 RepID=A0ABQ6BX09_9NEIS|nr:hypothetical protein GCM10007860_31160 [Chitiniphilus shinanonensis]
MLQNIADKTLATMKALLRKAATVASQLGGRLVLTLSACIASAVASMLINAAWVTQSEEQLGEMRNTRQRLDLLRDVDTYLVRAESAQRGFLIMGDANYLAPYDRRAEETRAALGALQEQVSRDPATEARLGPPLRRLGVAIGEKLAEMDLTIRFAHQGDLDRAHEITATDAGLKKSIQIGAAIKALIDFEKQHLEQQRRQRERMVTGMRVSLAVGAVLTALLVLLIVERLWRELGRRHGESAALAQRKRELDQLVEERTAQMETLAVEYQMDVERERHKLARDLHDELGSILTATKIDLSWVQRQLKDDHPQVVEKLNRTLRNLDHGIHFKRRVVQELHPSLLSTFGLMAAIRALAEDAAQRSGWTLHLTLPDENEKLDEVLGLIIYRILQETLTNATKYARATEVSVSLISDVDYLKLEIEDNGVGIDMHRLPEGTHGLQGMRHRVIAIGGKIDIFSEPGQGVFTCALLPKTLRPTGRPPLLA